MAPVTIGTGLVLIGLGVFGFLNSDSQPTALIPAYFGAAILVLGVLALKEEMRKHAMHGAVMLGLLGFLGSAYMVVKAGLSGEIARPLAFGMQIAMAMTCALFVALCVKSFIDARKRRQKAGA